MLTAWLLLRFAKWLGIVALVGGLAVTGSTAAPASRLRAALGVATGGLALAWLGGYGLLKLGGGGLDEPFVLGALLASLLAWIGGLLGALRPGRSLAVGLVAAGLTASVGWMVGRGDPVTMGILGVAVPLGVGLAAAMLTRGARAEAPSAEGAIRATERAFVWLARLEGVSFLLLLGVAVPLQRLAGIHLDGGQGWFGWVHGVLVLLYVPALVTAAVVGRWGVVAGLVGFVASLVPFGTFGFEAWLVRRTDRPTADLRRG